MCNSVWIMVLFDVECDQHEKKINNEQLLIYNVSLTSKNEKNCWVGQNSSDFPILPVYSALKTIKQM